MEYKGGLEKAILSNRTLLDELNDAFCKTNPWLAQKVTTRSAHAAVSKVSADALLAKALNIRRAKACRGIVKRCSCHLLLGSDMFSVATAGHGYA